MGYINEQNRKAVEDNIVNLMLDAKAAREDGLGLNRGGIQFLGDWASKQFDETGKIDTRTVLELVKETRIVYPWGREDYPHPDDEQLKWLDSLEALDAADREKIKRYMQPVAVNSGLFQRFNDRIAFLKKHNVRKLPLAEVKESTEQAEQRKAYQAIRDRVAALTAKDCGNVYSTRGGGAWDKTNALKRRLFAYLDACTERNVPAAMVAERVNADIENFRSTSIR